MNSFKVNTYKKTKNNKKYRLGRKYKKNIKTKRKFMKSKKNMKNRRKSKVSRKIKGGVGEAFVTHFKNIENRKRAEARRLEEEQRILDEEKFYDDMQRKEDKFSQAFSNDECAICLEDLDDDKNKSKMEKCLSCLDKKNKKLYFTDCEHTFHGRCLDKWLEENEHCPLCREYIAHIPYASEYSGR